jgi:hypothetical protein
MKIKSLFLAALLMIGVVVSPVQAADEPWAFAKMESFVVTPDDVELTSADATVTFKLVVSHPIGIHSEKTKLYISNNLNTNFDIFLNRTDNPIDRTKKIVTFEGKSILSRDMPPGPYFFYADSISGLAPNGGTNYPTGNKFYPPKSRTLVDAEDALLVRLNGDLKYNFQTFVGPSYPSVIRVSDSKNQTLWTETPIWKVGESYDPNNYFEKRTNDVQLEITSQTPETCPTRSGKLEFVTIGSCTYKIFTKKSNTYLYKDVDLTVQISQARVKPTINVESVVNQTVLEFPKSITRNAAYSSTGQIILPKSATPGVCIAYEKTILLSSSGLCKITYQTQADSNYLTSDLYAQTFSVSKEGEPKVAPTPVVSPTATPTPTAKPVVKKTISCVRGTKTIKKTAISPRCPTGYKLKK